MFGKNGGDDETRTRDLCRDSTQGLPNAAQVTQDVSNCGLGILRENCPERYLVSESPRCEISSDDRNLVVN